MPCTITDYWRYNAADGTAVAIVGAEILAVPDLNTRRYQIGGTGAYQSLATNPLITSAAYRYGRRTETSAGGQYSLVLPQSGESKPSTPAAKWSIVLPDGKVLSGTVPAVSGPLTLDDLETTHGWTWNSAVAVAPTSGTLARGTAPFSAQEYFDVVFGADFASAAYQIKLTPSVDSGTGNVPGHAWETKTASGFRIRMAGEFTGSVDWEATL